MISRLIPSYVIRSTLGMPTASSKGLSNMARGWETSLKFLRLLLNADDIEILKSSIINCTHRLETPFHAHSAFLGRI
jgi:hypothetical protein